MRILLNWPDLEKILILIVGCALVGCEKPKPTAMASKDASKNLETIKAEIRSIEPQTWPKIIRSQGSLMADDQAVIGSRVSGLVRETLVDVGDAVIPDQVLVTLDDSEFQLQLASAEAALLQSRALIGLQPGDPITKLDPLNAPPVREARATLEETRSRRERWQLLRGQNAVTEEEMQALLAAEKVADARYSSALNGVNSNIAQVAVRTAEVNLTKQRIRDSLIRAPFAGSVQQRLIAKGTFVQVGTPLLTIVRLDSLRFRGTIPERLATALQVGQVVSISIESIEEVLVANISRISPALDMSSRSLTFEALVDNSDGRLRAGLFAEAEVIIDAQAKAVVIDEFSLVEFAGSQKVWRVVNGVAKEQIVRPGRRSGGRIEIADGLKEGDQILVQGSIGRAAKIENISNSPGIAKDLGRSTDDPLPSSETKSSDVTDPKGQPTTSPDTSSDNSGSQTAG